MSNVDKLYDIQKYRYKIQKQEELIQYYEQMSHSLGGGGFEEKVQCTRSFEAPFAKWIYKKIDAESVHNDMERNLLTLVDEMTLIIEAIDDLDFRKIINYKFLQGYDWNQICDLMHISLSTAHRYLNKAMKALDAIKVDTP